LDIELKNQPSSGVPNKIFPAPLVQLSSILAPSRIPDAFVGGALPGLGCTGFKITPSAGATFNDADMGTVTIDGNSGTGPVIFQRVPMGGGLFGYVSTSLQPFPGGPPAGPPNIALKYAPVAKFIDKADTVSFSATGGANVKPIPKTEPITTVGTDLTVTTDLWHIAPSQVDGSNDFKVEYNCGGAACQDGTIAALQILTTDGSPPPPLDAGPGGDDLSQFQFPAPQANFGLVVCEDLLTANASAYNVDKSVISVLSSPWTALYVQVATAHFQLGATKDNDQIQFGGGHGYFGISRR